MPYMLHCTQDLLDLFAKEHELIVIDDVVDPCLDLAEIQRQAAARESKALLFTNVKGTRFAVATNLYGSAKRIDLAFGPKPEQVVNNAVTLLTNNFPPSLKTLWQQRSLVCRLLKTGTKKTRNAPVLEAIIPSAYLFELPQIKSWPEDGGAFITLPLVYTESPITKKANLGMYRVQLFSERCCGMHVQIQRGGGFHLHEAEQQNQPLPVHIYIGGPPALTMAAIAPLPENVPEILLASFLAKGHLGFAKQPDLSPLPFIAEADFCIVGDIPPFERKPEGPFGDHYGYYSLKHEFPFVNVSAITHRKNAVFPATVVGRPPQEDHHIAIFLQDLLAPVIKLVMPQVHSLWAHSEAGVHSLGCAVVKDRYPREALVTSLRVLGEGQLSLTKILLVTSASADPKDIKTFLPAVLERMDFVEDLFVLTPTAHDTLDYTGTGLNHGSKALFLGVGEKKRELPKDFSGTLPESFTNAVVFCPGVLAVTIARDNELRSSRAHELTNLAMCDLRSAMCEPLSPLTQCPALKDWSLVFVFDNAKAATATSRDFLWHAFTRFAPATDIYPAMASVQNNHLGFCTPLVIDCRLKPGYPLPLESDPDVVKRVRPLVEKYL